ncbi:ATP-binding protein [Microbacterium luticocti]|uniref:ATP-binding protein n=1 Tax=Microbacterium luticocti TaxID=451764 RepID=UPI00146C2797|nr:ATP-binding protein [Microbacterium luticocti]
MSVSTADRQFRIERVQVLNWGAYRGHKEMRVSRSGTAILGPSGRGKSTLLDAMASVILPNPQEFNQAARDDKGGRRERTVYTYARGLTDRRRDENNPRSGTTTFLRPVGGPGFPSGAAITWVHDDGRRITVLRLAWVASETTTSDAINAATVYGIVHDDFDLRRLDGITGNRAGSSPLTRHTLASLINEERGDLIDASQGRIHQRMRTAMQMGRTEESQKLAMQLLRRAQASKGIFNINTLFKEFVLTEPLAMDRWATALEAYREASRLYDEFEKARKRLHTLEGLPEAAERYDVAERGYIHKQRMLNSTGADDRLKVWHDELLHDWANRKAEDARLAHAQIKDEHQLAVKDNDAAQQTADDVLAAIVAAGGDPTGTLVVRRESVVEKLHAIEHRRAEVQQDLAGFDLSLPASAGDLELLRDTAMAMLTKLRAEEERLNGESKGVVLAWGDLDRKVRDLKRQIEELDHNSNVPEWARKLRADIQTATGIPAARMPYFGELLQVKPEHQGWEKAVLSVLLGAARYLVVADRDLKVVRDYVNSTDTGNMVRLHRAGSASPRTPIPGTIPELLDVTEGPYRDWVRSELVNHYSVAYVEDARELDEPLPPGVRGRVTRAGMRTESQDRFVKDDTRVTYRWIGWDTTRLRDDLRGQSEAAERELYLATTASDAASAAVQAVRDRCRELSAVIGELDWSSLDVEPLKARIADLDEQIANADTPELSKQRRRLHEAQRRVQETGGKVATLFQRMTAMNTAWAQLVDVVDAAADGMRESTPLSAEEKEAVRELGFTDPLYDIGGSASLKVAITDSYRKAASDLKSQVERHVADRESQERIVLGIIRAYRNLDDRAYDEVDEDIAALPAMLAIREQLVKDDLPSRKQRWLEKVQEDMNSQLRALVTQIDHDRHEIQRGLKPIKEVLSTVPFREGSRLTIESTERRSPELTDLMGKITAHTSNTLGLLATEDAETVERDFLKLRRDLRRLDDLSKTGDAWRKRVFDAREQVEFRAIETRPDGVEIVHDGVSGMSGGEGQELIAFILGAALRYRLGEGSENAPVYASIILDEGFVKADSDYTGRALGALSALGFQLIIGAPREKATAFEGHVENVAYISTDTTNVSGVHIYEMTIEEALSLDAELTDGAIA